MASRLSELKSKRAEEEAKSPNANKKKGKKDDEDLEMQANSPSDAGQQIELVKASIKVIQGNTAKLVKLNDKALFSPNEQKEIMNELEKLVTSSKNEALKTKKNLEKLEKECRQMEAASPGSTSAQMRRNMIETQQRDLANAVRDYQEAGDKIRDGMRDKIKRQARIVDANISEGQIEQAINSNDPGIVLREALGVSDQALDAVAELEERHERMRAIEQGVREVLELFQDLAIMIDQQQETIDHIESNVNSAKEKTKKGAEEIVIAQKSQKKSRKMMCIGLGLAVVVMIIIIIAVASK
jgi:t-SNARE complex subunit (syntaxin)